MLSILLTRDASRSRQFYRLELGTNLFGDYSVLREWGPRGARGPKGGRRLIAVFSNLREAFIAAERWHQRAERRGYRQLHGGIGLTQRGRNE